MGSEEHGTTAPQDVLVRTVDPTAAPLGAVVLDGGQRAALVATRSLGRRGLTVGVTESRSRRGVPAFASVHCSERLLLPPVVGDDSYVAALREVLERTRPRVVVPVHDSSVAVLDQHRAELGALSRLLLPGPGALDVLTDKRATLALARRLGVPTPRGAPLADLRDADAVAREVGLPAVVKPVASWAIDGEGRGSRLACTGVRTVDELRTAAGRVLAAGGRVLVQEWLPGRRDAVSVVAVAGRPMARFAQVAHRMSPPLGGSSVVRESVPLPADATRHADHLVEALGLDGYAEVEFRRDANGRPALMEVNPRLSASVEIAVRSGVDFPWLMYLAAEGEPLPRQDGYREGVRQRWLGGDLLWLRSCLRDPRQLDAPPALRAVGTFVGEFGRSGAYDYADARDPWPAVSAAAHMAGATLRSWARAAAGRPGPTR